MNILLRECNRISKPALIKQILEGLLSLTSAILLTEVREPPDVSEANTEPEDSEEELDGAVPGHPGLPRPLLRVHNNSLKLFRKFNFTLVSPCFLFSLDVGIIRNAETGSTCPGCGVWMTELRFYIKYSGLHQHQRMYNFSFLYVRRHEHDILEEKKSPHM